MQARTALTLGMHHSFFRHGLSSFFSAPLGDGVGQFQLHRWRPAIATSSGCALPGLAGHGHQVGFLPSIKFTPLPRPRQVIEGGSNPPSTRCRTRVEGPTIRAFATCWSVRPSSALHKIRDRFTLRPEDWPRRVSQQMFPFILGQVHSI